MKQQRIASNSVINILKTNLNSRLNLDVNATRDSLNKIFDLRSRVLPAGLCMDYYFFFYVNLFPLDIEIIGPDTTSKLPSEGTASVAV
jgi:hypothetical protein